MLVDSWLARAAAQRPQHPALQTPAEDWSYAQLYAAARFAAGELAARGAAPGDRVAIALPPGLAFAQALHACLLLGAVAVLVDLRLAPAEREGIAAGAAICLEEPLSPLTTSATDADRYVATRHDLNATAVVIHTSGTTSAPKPIELTYGNFLWSGL